MKASIRIFETTEMVALASRLFLHPSRRGRWLKNLTSCGVASVSWEQQAVPLPKPVVRPGPRAAWKAFLDFGEAVGAFWVGKRGQPQPAAGCKHL